jgi:RNase P subunit RPR2
MPKKSAKPAAKKAAKKTPMAEGEGYCVKCKTKRMMTNVKRVKMANGRPALKGTCPVCGTGMFKILSPS